MVANQVEKIRIGLSYDSQENIQKGEHTIHHSFITESIISFFIFKFYRFYIYGGHDIKEGSLDSLWMVDLAKMSESKPLEEPS
jgi:hypothetical protein